MRLSMPFRCVIAASVSGLLIDKIDDNDEEEEEEDEDAADDDNLELVELLLDDSGMFTSGSSSGCWP
jgi:hypothetical protein